MKGKRDLILRKVLLDTLTEEEVNALMSYIILSEDIEFIKKSSNEVLKNIPLKAFNCATLSALLGAIIQDNSNIPVAVIAGHFDYYDRRIFNCKRPIPYSINKKLINEIWDGHCWVELSGLIIDISIFRTVYFGDVPPLFREKIIKAYGENHGMILASPMKFIEAGFNYTPCYCLTQDQINGLIKGAKIRI